MVATFGVRVMWFLERILVVCEQGVCGDERIVDSC